MTASFAQIALLALLGMLLMMAAYTDLRARTIGNGLNLAIALLAIPFWFANGLSLWPDVALQLGVAAIVFALFAGAFALGMMGGGDVKMLGALALWLPADLLLRFLLIMSIAGGLLTLVMIVRARMKRSGSSPEVPYGVAISAAGLWLISERFLYQFG